MKKIALLILTILFLFPFSSALDLEVKEIKKENVIITELSNNATFSLSIKNLEEESDNFQIYSLVQINIFPKGLFMINSGEKLNLDIVVEPQKSTRENQRGIYAFQYQIKGQQIGVFKDFLTIRILDVKDAIKVSTKSISLKDKTATLTIENLEEFHFENLEISAESEFFQFSETLNLEKKESKEFIVPINLKEKISAGKKELELEFTFNDISSKKIVTFQYLEKGGISVTQNSEGFLIRKTSTTKTNEGNIQSTTSIEITKNVLTRLFTIFSKKPEIAERRGIFVDYSWKKNVEVGEEFTITATTNYTIPFMLIILILFVTGFTKYLMAQKVIIRKRVSAVKTKGGEFALKVKLKVKAKKPVKNVILTDTLPRMTKLYDKFGAKPHKIDSQTRKISWNLKNLNTGEQRVFTYIIYSKINIVGKFELPLATASYEIDGMKEHSSSNRTSFFTETVE